jgi:hypothetical protein
MLARIHGTARTLRHWIIASPLAALVVIMLALLLASCGNSSPSNNATRPSGKYAYLYSGIDYPLQIPVNGSDTVTLTLSPNSNLVATAPGKGQGKASAEPIPLPIDLRSYQDIATSAEVANTGPVVWQLTSASRQSLLTPVAAGVSRRYVDLVTFTWHVQATAAGTNTAQIILHLYYVYTNGASHAGTVLLTPAAVPIVAVDNSPLTAWLAQVKLPFASLTSLAGIIGLFRFVQGIAQTAGNTVETVKKTVEVAGKVQQHFHPTPGVVPHSEDVPPTIKRPGRP